MSKTNSKKVLDRVSILGKDDRAFTEVDVTEEWGGIVRLQSMSAKQIFAFQRDSQKGGKTDEEKALGLLAVRSIVDDEGRRLFSDEDLEPLLQQSAAALTKIARAALALNKLTADDVRLMAGN